VVDEPVDGREFHSLKGRLQVVMMERRS